ncbi:MAG TPA: RIO1 family regulatory kinase/ATPase [Candidatus Polarisedimenticolia bacterium]|nr:RIO1 family regulatory kinase/ATPase [Candidatus Polarisedimenticolia bacterium]
MPAAPSRLPGAANLKRADLPGVFSGYIKKGAWNKADVLLVTLTDGRFAVKDYASKAAPVRWSGALQLAREARAYRRLEGLSGIPRFFGQIDRHAILLEYVGGIRLPKFHHRHGGVPRVAQRLKELMDAVHERGVIHGDLRSRDNLLVTAGGDLYLIDFSSAAVFDRSTWWGRRIFPRLRRAENRALLKWKVALTPADLTPEELAQHRRFKRFRRLWPFNRKTDLPRTKGRNPLL